MTDRRVSGRNMSTEHRLAFYTERSDGPTGCWLWVGSRFSSGYGSIWTGERNALAHRVAYELTVGPVPDGLVLDHLCRNRACVNPAHLEPVTQRTNVLRGAGSPAQRARTTHCPQGHPYDQANTYVDGRGHRSCRECRAAARARHRQREAVR